MGTATRIDGGARSQLDGLAEHIDEAVRRATQHRFDTYRAMANEAGITARSADFDRAYTGIAEAQEAKRQADEAARVAKEAYDAIAVEAEWQLGTHFTVKANKTWLIVDAEGNNIDEAEQRSLTADEKRAWIAQHVAGFGTVVNAAKALREAEFEAVIAADNVKLADKAFTAARLQFEGALARLTALSGVIKES